jgi:hypothetical protein
MTVAERKQYDDILREVKDEEKAGLLWMRWKVLTDLYFLGGKVFGLEEAKGLNGRHRLDEKLHRQMAKYLESDEDYLLLYPRLHMKTTWAKFSMIQRLLVNPLVRQGLWSRTSGLVRKELANIKILLCNPRIRQLFPDLIPDPGKNFNGWEKSTADVLTVYRPKDLGTIPQENQIEVWGVEATVVGHHYDVHYYDDVLDRRTVATQEQIEKLMEWWQHIQAIRELTAIEKMIGTRYHMRDLYGMVIQEKVFGDNYVIRRVVEAGKPIYGFFTMKDIEKMRRKMGEYTFATQMMNDAVPPEDKLFVPPYPVWDAEMMGEEEQIFYLTFDPAPTTKQWSNYTGFTAASVPAIKKDRLYYHEARRLKLEPDKLAEFVVDKIWQYKPRRVGIEYGLQTALGYLIEAKIRERENQGGQINRPRFIPISIGNTSKGDKIGRTLGAFTRDNRAFFKHDMRELFTQMDNFNPHSKGNEDDILDAASMMIQTVEYFAPSQWQNVEAYQFGSRGMTVEDLFKTTPDKWWSRKFAYGA